MAASTTSEQSDPNQVNPASGLAGLRDIRAMLDNTSRVAQLADALRGQIIHGELRPGTQLSEQSAAETLGVSRNTLREAFRLLSHEGLLVHQVHRGVFVRTLDAADVREIYTTRRVVECAAVESIADRPADPVVAAGLAAVRAAVSDAEAAAESGNWTAVGTADLRFHSALTGLAGSRHLDDLMHRMLAELRLAFAVISDPRRLHAPYLTRNVRIAALLESGDVAAANAALRGYFDDAEAELLAEMADLAN